MIDGDPTDLGELRQRFPAWHISVSWSTRATGPDARVLRAQHGSLVLTAWSVPELAEQIEGTEPSR
jgi:hypothetical protein